MITNDSYHVPRRVDLSLGRILGPGAMRCWREAESFNIIGSIIITADNFRSLYRSWQMLGLWLFGRDKVSIWKGTFSKGTRSPAEKVIFPPSASPPAVRGRRTSVGWRVGKASEVCINTALLDCVSILLIALQVLWVDLFTVWKIWSASLETN